MELPNLPDSTKVKLLTAHRELILMENQRNAVITFLNTTVSEALAEAKLDANDYDINVNTLQFVEKPKLVEAAKKSKVKS
jgi:hypothetical protein